MMTEAHSKSEEYERHLLTRVLPNCRPGDQIPSELQMAKELGTSRTTMHKVYFNLMSRGLIYRKNGVGTFVAEPPAEAPRSRVEMITAVMPSLHLLNASETPNWFNHQYTLEYFADAAREDNYILNVVFFDHDRYGVDDALRLLNRDDVKAFLFPAMVPELAPVIDRLTERGKVCIGRYFEAANFCHSVYVEFGQAAIDAVAHLAAEGRRRIAILDGWTPGMPAIAHYGHSIARHQGYRQGMEKAGVPFIRELCRLCPPNPEDGEWAVRRMLEEGLRFDAILCGTDQRAFGVLKALQKAGIRVPEEVAVIGNGDLREDAETDPPLASMEISFPQIGRELYVLLRELLKAPAGKEYRSRVCHSRFIRRASAGKV